MTNPFDGLTALVVEDDGLVREDVAEWFRQQGWSVFETAIGAGALQLIREAGPRSSSLHGYQPRRRHHRMGCRGCRPGVASRPCGHLCLRRAEGSWPPRASEYFSVQACVAG